TGSLVKCSVDTEYERYVRCLRDAFNSLREQQMEALERATFVGMTPGDAREFESRHYWLAQLMMNLTALRGGSYESETQETPRQGAKTDHVASCNRSRQGRNSY